MATKFKTLREFLYPQGKKVTFEIPNYQRGYKWGVKERDDRPSSVEYLLSSLISAWKCRPDQLYFLQGITVSETENKNKIEIIDGQQRITTLYLILRVLGVSFISDDNNIALQYSVRPDSQKYLENLKDGSFNWVDIAASSPQDIFYFREAMKQIRGLFENEDVDFKLGKERDFANYLLDKVTFLYIVVDRQQAVNTFTMMNGNKATMHQEELVKAKMLHQVSLPMQVPEKDRPSTFDELLDTIKDYTARDWEADALRSRYAREWDKWLYWWNRKDVRDFFGSGNKPMGLLLRYYSWGKNIFKSSEDIRYECFKELLGSTTATKTVFKEIRDLQKKFEDVFWNPLSHNYLKLALICSTGWKDKFQILKYYFSASSDVEKMKQYAQWRLVGATHLAIIGTDDEPESDTKEDCARNALDQLSDDNIYCDDSKKDEAFKQLLRLNVEEYNKLNGGVGVAFDFSIWNCRSLEHILPKSKVFHMEERDGISVAIRGDGEYIGDEETAQSQGLIKREDVFKGDGSEHCIGNLVLLYRDNNSSFGDSDFEEKKRLFFDMESSDFRFDSRSLLHSIAVFSEVEWTPETIRTHREMFLKRFRADYGLDKEAK